MIDLGFEVDAEDLEAQDRLLARFDEISGRHFRRAAMHGLHLVIGGWRGETPMLTGKYRGSIQGRVDRVVGMEVKATAYTGATQGRGGFAYPARLESSKKFSWRATGRASRGTMRRMLRSKAEPLMERFWKALDGVLREMVVR